MLQLARRKNRPHGSVIVRACWCSRCPITCPVHALAAWLRSFNEADRPFAHILAQQASSDLKARLAGLGIAHAYSYWPHDVRRGNTQDLTERGSSLIEILRARERRTPAFLKYVDVQELEKDAVVQTHVIESDSDSDASSS